MNAPARGTASDYSKGTALHRGDFVAPAALALAGAALLVVAELSPLYTVVVGALETPRRSVSAGASHGWVLALVALAAAVMALGALRGARGAALALVALGVVTLLVAGAVDAPRAERSDGLPEATAYADARAKPGRALALELAGGCALLVAGAVALVRGSRPRAR